MLCDTYGCLWLFKTFVSSIAYKNLRGETKDGKEMLNRWVAAHHLIEEITVIF